MHSATLIRSTSSAEGTFGVFAVAELFSCYSLELPWRENAQKLSCIPTGSYWCRVTRAGRTIGGRRNLYLLSPVPGRSGILIHAGTFAGDIKAGLKADVLGCIILGLAKGQIGGQRCLLNSRLAMSRFMNLMDGKDFKLTIVEAT